MRCLIQSDFIRVIYNRERKAADENEVPLLRIPHIFLLPMGGSKGIIFLYGADTKRHPRTS